MQKTKLLFTDIDGTLILPDQSLSPKVAAGLERLYKAGCGIILSSGRPLDSILNVYKNAVESAGVTAPASYVIANNGALVYDCGSEKTIFEERVPLGLIDDIQKLSEKMNVHLQTYTDDAIVCKTDNEEIHFYTRRIHLPVIYSEKLSAPLKNPPFKLLAISLKGSEDLYGFQKAVTEGFGDRLNCFFSGSGYLELVSKKADKGNALRFLAEHLQVPIENTYSVGDSENDLSMLLAAGWGYAMANAEDIVLQKAPRITKDTNLSDGILEVFEAILR